MNFLQFDIGNCQRGEIVEITLTNGANVRLMSSSDFSNYKNGRQHRYIGGLAKQSPVRLQVPNSGHWYVAVDMQGLRGSTRASVRKLPGMLPEIREAPLASIPSLVRDPPPQVESGAEGPLVVSCGTQHSQWPLIGQSTCPPGGCRARKLSDERRG